MPNWLPETTNALYGELLQQCLPPLPNGDGLTFKRKTQAGKRYIYLAAKVGTGERQRFVGPDTEDTQKKVETTRHYWQNNQETRVQRARLVTMYLAGGGSKTPHIEGRILGLMQDAGCFAAGGILIGSPAFRLMGNALGVKWSSVVQTRDVDLAIDYKSKIALPDKKLELSKVLLESGLGLLEIPAFDPRSPSTSYKLRGKDYIVDILTPLRGRPKKGPIFIKAFNTHAQPLRYLDFIMEDPQVAVIPYKAGLVVNIPSPARFALHKLVISQMRDAAFRTKSKKDIDQATQILEVLFEIAPGDVVLAREAAEQMGPAFLKRLERGRDLLPEEIREQWSSWLETA